ncbi:MAG: hypothetical protein IT534_06835 [Bauldia sp.]|nr:hypothetical protein [Bauldia sp.]
MRKLARWGALALLPLLGGCFDMRNDLSVAPDGTATLVASFALSADMMGMMGAAAGAGGGAPAADDDFCPDDMDEVPEGFTATSERTTAGNGDLVCTMTITGPLDRLNEVMEGTDFNPGGGIEGDDGQITLVAEGGNVYLYTLTFAIPKEDPPTPEEAAMQAAMMQAMREMMTGRTMTWSVTAPRILSTTGTLDGNTATFVIPVTDMIDNTGGEYTFEVRFGL